MVDSLKDTSRYLEKLGLTGPSVVIDQDRVRRNLQVMAARAAAVGARFRPHFKTHQSGTVGMWFTQEGVGCISALVYDPVGEVAGGLSISAPIERRRDEWIPLLKQAAKDISDRLGYTGKDR